MTNQAPPGKWRYGCVKRVYVTKFPDKKFQETIYELAEVFNEGKSWTAEAISLSASSPADLIHTLERAIADLKKYSVITEKPVTIRRIGKPCHTKKATE